eukprot:Ihof_evm4s625 gene=Ihof_evmTU4s625
MQSLSAYPSEMGSVDSLNRKLEFVYTIGCFDLIHEGHVRLFNSMRSLGRKVIVGIHDDPSIYALKNRIPFDSMETRIANIAKYVDVVFAITGANPSGFIKMEILRQ